MRQSSFSVHIQTIGSCAVVIWLAIGETAWPVPFNLAPDGDPILGAGIDTFGSDDVPIVASGRAPIGKNTVSVETEMLRFGNAAAYVAIPAKYASPATSGLTADLQPGENAGVDFALEAAANPQLMLPSFSPRR